MRQAPLPLPEDERADDELMRLAAAGERAAFESLVRRHQARVRAYCARWCGNGSLGDDLAQECFVELWRRRKNYVPEGKLRAYLFHIAANRCKNQQRAEGRRLALLDAGAAASQTGERAPISDRFALHERHGQLQAGLGKLPELQREAVLLRYSAELDYAEIASLLAAPEATVRSRVFLGLIKLRRLLRRENEA